MASGQNDPLVSPHSGPSLTMWALDDSNELLTPYTLTFYKTCKPRNSLIFRVLHNNLGLLNMRLFTNISSLYLGFY